MGVPFLGVYCTKLDRLHVSSSNFLLNKFPAVDLLRSVGLREDVISPSDSVVTDGPNNQPAFRLERQLSASTSSKEWELIAAQLPTQFGIYASFNALLFEGSILSIVNTTDNTVLLDVSYTSVDSTDSDSLEITLPGNSPISFKVPTATADAPFHNIGIRLDGSALIVVLNCSLLDFVTLESAVDPFSLTNTIVNVYERQAIVSSLYAVQFFVQKHS